jgi:hypothetical protein
VRVIFTGRPVFMESLLATISWPKGSLLPPKPPPFGQAITRTWAGDISRTFARARWT